jgi:hypothetical protein
MRLDRSWVASVSNWRRSSGYHRPRRQRLRARCPRGPPRSLSGARTTATMIYPHDDGDPSFFLSPNPRRQALLVVFLPGHLARWAQRSRDTRVLYLGSEARIGKENGSPWITDNDLVTKFCWGRFF